MAGVGLLGSGLNMFMGNSAASSSANAQAQAQYARARALQEQAKWVKAAGALRHEDMKRGIDMAIGRTVAAAGGAGVRQEGSIISQAVSGAAQGARDLFNDKFQTDANVANLETGASNATMSGNMIQDQATMGNNMRLLNFIGGAGLSLAGAGLNSLTTAGSYTGANSIATAQYGSPAPYDAIVRGRTYGGPR